LEDESMSETKIRIGTGTFCAVLFFILLIMKLTGYIDWSWWLITAPIWIPLVFVVVTLAIIGAITLWEDE
jgi:hypothetical protein